MVCRINDTERCVSNICFDHLSKCQLLRRTGWIGILLHVIWRLFLQLVWVLLVIDHLWWVWLIVRILVVDGLLLSIHKILVHLRWLVNGLLLLNLKSIVLRFSVEVLVLWLWLSATWLILVRRG